MKQRHEYKFLLHTGAYMQLRKLLKNVMQPDHNSINNEGYHIRSLYFDDIYDTALKEKYLGYINRKKFRIRIYDYSDRVIKLEIKEKHQDYVQKKACIISRDEYQKILSGDTMFLHDGNNGIKEKYYLEFRNNLLKPKVIVDYLREAYVLPYNQIRITFDKNLSAAKPHENIFDRDIYSKQVGQEYAIILEVKYNNFFPNHLRQVLEMYCNSRLAVSKYLICRECLTR